MWPFCFKFEVCNKYPQRIDILVIQYYNYALVEPTNIWSYNEDFF